MKLSPTAKNILFTKRKSRARQERPPLSRVTTVIDVSDPHPQSSPARPVPIIVCDMCKTRRVPKLNPMMIVWVRQAAARELPTVCDVCSGPLEASKHVVKPKSAKQSPFVCHACSKSYLRADRLVAHAHLHTGKKAFACLTCGSLFARKYILHRHIQRSHTIDPVASCHSITSDLSRPECSSSSSIERSWMP